MLSERVASRLTTFVVPSAPDRSSNTLCDRGISLLTTLNCVYEMKSKYSGSVSLPCSILSGEYCCVYGSHSLCRDFQKLIWNVSMAITSMASTVSYVDRSSSTASLMSSGARGNRTGSGGNGKENPCGIGRYWLGAVGDASFIESSDARCTAAFTLSRAACSSGVS